MNKDTQQIWEAYGHEYYSDEQIDKVINHLKTAEDTAKVNQSYIQLAYEISEKQKEPLRDELNRFIKQEGYYLAYLPSDKNLDYVLLDTEGGVVEKKYGTIDDARDGLYDLNIMKKPWYNSGQYE
jgi:hypothetical protein